VGTSSPNEKLTISSGAISFLGEISTPSIGAGLFRPANNTLAVVTGSTERMRITSAGNVMIGTTSHDGNGMKLQVEHSSSATDGRVQAHGFSCRDNFGSVSNLGNGIASTASNTLVFATNSTERMRINSSGTLLWASTVDPNSSNSGISFNNATHPAINISGGSDTNFRHRIVFHNGNGVVGIISTSGSSTAYATSSDYRLKENVVEMTDATTRLKQLQPKRFNFIADADTTVDGFLAHEVQSVVPEAITGTHNEVDDDGNPVYQGIDQSKLVPLLVKTIQELEARIVALENA
jgi:hypothetical protein